MASILSLPSAEARVAAVNTLLKSHNLAELEKCLDVVVEESTLVSASKPILQEVVRFAGADETDAAFGVQVAELALKKITQRSGSFMDERLGLREILADAYQSAGQLQVAIKHLTSLPVEVGLRSNEDDYKAELFVRIAELNIAIDDTVAAETFLNKAWPLQKKITDKNMKLRFNGCFATLMDVKRKFVDAGQRFYEVSKYLDDWLVALQKAIVCVVLADAGPARSRLLASLYRDERTAGLGDLSLILSKVFHSRVMRPKDVELLQAHLLSHHRAVTASGRTVVDVAIQQHNLQAASQLYFNISFSELGGLLGISSEAAERVAAQMIQENRLKATIDQVREVIFFANDAAAPIVQWDTQISAACNTVSSIADSICQVHHKYNALLGGAKA